MRTVTAMAILMDPFWFFLRLLKTTLKPERCISCAAGYPAGNTRLRSGLWGRFRFQLGHNALTAPIIGVAAPEPTQPLNKPHAKAKS